VAGVGVGHRRKKGNRARGSQEVSTSQTLKMVPTKDSGRLNRVRRKELHTEPAWIEEGKKLSKKSKMGGPVKGKNQKVQRGGQRRKFQATESVKIERFCFKVCLEKAKGRKSRAGKLLWSARERGEKGKRD